MYEQKPTLRIGVMGGDACLHRFLCSYIAVVEEFGYEFVMQTVDLQVFLIPTAKMDMASYPASQDGFTDAKSFL